MWFVYVIKSVNHPFLYVGFTNDLDKRLSEHNLGLSPSTRPYAPYILEAYVALKSKSKAIGLEKYFKTGSGKAVLRNRILDESHPK